MSPSELFGRTDEARIGEIYDYQADSPLLSFVIIAELDLIRAEESECQTCWILKLAQPDDSSISHLAARFGGLSLSVTPTHEVDCLIRLTFASSTSLVASRSTSGPSNARPHPYRLNMQICLLDSKLSLQVS